MSGTPLPPLLNEDATPVMHAGGEAATDPLVPEARIAEESSASLSSDREAADRLPTSELSPLLSEEEIPEKEKHDAPQDANTADGPLFMGTPSVELAGDEQQQQPPGRSSVSGATAEVEHSQRHCEEGVPSELNDESQDESESASDVSMATSPSPSSASPASPKPEVGAEREEAQAVVESVETGEASVRTEPESPLADEPDGRLPRVEAAPVTIPVDALEKAKVEEGGDGMGGQTGKGEGAASCAAPTPIRNSLPRVIDIAELARMGSLRRTVAADHEDEEMEDGQTETAPLEDQLREHVVEQASEGQEEEIVIETLQNKPPTTEENADVSESDKTGDHDGEPTVMANRGESQQRASVTASDEQNEEINDEISPRPVAECEKEEGQNALSRTPASAENDKAQEKEKAGCSFPDPQELRAEETTAARLPVLPAASAPAVHDALLPRVRRLSRGGRRHEDDDAHLLRLRRSLLSAFPLHVRRYYSLSLTAEENGSTHNHRHHTNDSSDDEEDSQLISSHAVDSVSGTIQRTGGRAMLCGNCVPANILEASTATELSVAAAKCESLLLRAEKRERLVGDDESVSLRAARSTVPDVPKALPLLLAHLCEDKYYVNGAWRRHHDDSQFVKAGSSIAVRKRRRASVLGTMVHESPSITTDVIAQQHQASLTRKKSGGGGGGATTGGASSNSKGAAGHQGRQSLRSQVSNGDSGSIAGQQLHTLEELLAYGDGSSTVPTPRTVFTLKDWRAEGEEAVRAYQRRRLAAAATTATVVGSAAGSSQASPTSATSATAASAFPSTQSQHQTSSTAAVNGGGAFAGEGAGANIPSTAAGAAPSGTIAASAAPPGRRLPHSSTQNKKTSSAVGASQPATTTAASAVAAEGVVVPSVDAYDVLTREEMSQYAKFAMSSGRLRYEVKEPFSTLTTRASNLRMELLLKKL